MKENFENADAKCRALEEVLQRLRDHGATTAGTAATATTTGTAATATTTGTAATANATTMHLVIHATMCLMQFHVFFGCE
jgi:hypothetical protein